MFERNNKGTIAGAFTLLLIFCLTNVAGVQAYSDGRPTLRGAASTNVKLEGEAVFAHSTQPITVSLRESDVKQAIRMFADKAGLNVVFHEKVKGNITMDLVNVPLGDAIRMITQMAELTYVVDGDTVLIMPNEDAKKMDVTKRQLSVIPLKYIYSQSAADFLNANVFKKSRPGLSNSSIATSNPVRNELILLGTDEDFRVAQKILSKIDVKPLISTYKVNHTTPKEMAAMLCTTLFGIDAENNNTGTNSAWEGDVKLGGAYKACTIDKQNVKGKNAGNTSQIVDAKNLKEGELYDIQGNSMTISYLPGIGNVQVVGGSPEQIQLISDFIAHNDRKQPQAYIEISIVELNESGSKEFSNTWNIYSNFFTGSIGGDGIKTAESYPIFWKSVNNLTDYSHLNYGPFLRGLVLENPSDVTKYYSDYSQYLHDYDTYTNITLPAWKEQAAKSDTPSAMPEPPSFTPPSVGTQAEAFRYGQPAAITQSLNYVVQNGKGRVLSNPKIVVTNGKQSLIDLSSDYVKSVQSQVLQNTGSLMGTTQKTYNIANDNGMKIQIVPFISPDGYVSLNLKPEYATVSESLYAQTPTGPELVATLLKRRNLELSNLRIKDGETLVIGGLVQEYEAKTVSKTPLLGDLPVVGMLFRNSTTTNNKQELVILITPRIIKDNEDIVGNSGTNL